MQPYFGEQIVSIFQNDELTNERIAKLQEQDKILNQIKEHLVQNTKPDFGDPGIKAYQTTYRKLFVDGDVVMKRHENGPVALVPEGEIPRVLRSVHGGPLASHYGISKDLFFASLGPCHGRNPEINS